MSRVRDELGRWIYPAVRPDGRRVDLLKVLQSNICTKDCGYCAQRAGRDARRTTFTPDELARAFDDLVRRNRVHGLFLSSGVCGNVTQATDRMLATVDLVRNRYHYGGYIHLKILPGAEEASIERSLQLADRVSVNLEAPSARRIRAISHTKDFERELVQPLRIAHRLRTDKGFCSHWGKPVTMTTQFVVGASDESDRETLSMTADLYDEIALNRAYFSAFQPVVDTPLEGHAPTPAWREHRLYQADFLLRDYGFEYGEFVFDEAGNLPRCDDPKAMWAQYHPEFFPIELNTASREQLLRIPGIGPGRVGEILGRRRTGRLRELKHIGLNGKLAARAAPYVLLDGVQPAHQPPLFAMPS